MLALERSDHGFSGESRGGHARRERLPQAGLRGSHRHWASRHSLSGRTQGGTARHATTPTPERLSCILAVTWNRWVRFRRRKGRLVRRISGRFVPAFLIVMPLAAQWL